MALQAATLQCAQRSSDCPHWIEAVALRSAEDLSASEKAELAANRGRYPGRPLQLLLGGPLGGVVNVGAAAKAAVQTPLLSWAFFRVRSNNSFPTVLNFCSDYPG